MKKEPAAELWQLQIAIISLIGHLQDGPDHLDDLTAKTVARALAEIVQEAESFPKEMSRQEIAQFTLEVLVGTEDMQQALEARWRDELTPVMERARERAENLGHNLAEFTCLSVDGEEWGAVCMRCMQWVYVRPEETAGVLLSRCVGWRGRYLF
ncbi:MAG TPA: hypothetical protein VK879_17990 [Candidatus Sulfomarinibacteraceae bacterium]|nr:hypothetical protein [Candidatus Sulfomarinibacteraceae bacterium]